MTVTFSPLADRVRSIRQSCEINQKQLASRSGLSQATISRIESGKITQLTIGSLIRLADALDTNTSQLLGEKDVAATDNYIARLYSKLPRKHQKVLIEFAEFLNSKKGDL